MRRFTLLTLTLLLFMLGLGLAATKLHAQTGQDTHQVQSGETLFSISQRYDVAISDLREWNDLQSDQLDSGMTLRLIPPAESGSVTHTVGARETLFAISRRYGVTIAEIQQWNRLESTSLSEGQQLVIHPDGAPGQNGAPGQTAAAETPRREASSGTSTATAPTATPPSSPPSGTPSGDTSATSPDTGPDSLADASSESSSTESATDIDSATTAEPATDTDPVTSADPVSPDAADEIEPRIRESVVAPAATVNTYYTVRSGDYLNRIAAEHGMTTEELRQLNQLESDMLRVGQQLIVKSLESTPVVDPELGESTPQGRFVTYRTQSGDSAERVMERFSMSMDALKALNPGTDFSSLGSGQRITVLLPPSRQFANPYQRATGLRGLGEIPVTPYNESASTPTTSGELYDPQQLTAAHANMTLGSIVYLENPDNGRGSYVKINDRFSGDGIKLSQYAYQLLGLDGRTQSRVVLYQEE